MGSNWPLVKLCDYADFQEGYVNPTQKKPEYFDGPVKWLRAVDLNDGFVYKTSRTLSLQGFESAGKSAKLFEPGTLAISKSGTIGRIGILKDYMCGNRAVINVKPHKNTLDTWFAFYILKYRRPDVEQLAIGSVQPNLYTSALGSLQFHLPPLNIQHSISSLLSSIDKKIESNRQISQTLEQMAQVLFKSWFVDFDPVVDNALDAGFFEQNLSFPDELLRRAEARKAVRESGISLEKSKPLPDAISQLFPAAFEECGEPSLGLGGWVPQGWGIDAVSDIAFINKESWTKNNAPKKIKYVDLSNAKDGTILGIQEYFFEEAPSRARRILKKRDTIFGMVRPANRSFAYVDRDGLTGSTGFVVISAKNKNTSSFIYQKLTSNSVVEDLIRVADGAAYPAIKPDDISELMMVVPNKCILDLFEQTIDGYRERVAHNLNNNEQLANLRDILLPKLISGELQLDKIEAELAKEVAI